MNALSHGKEKPTNDSTGRKNMHPMQKGLFTERHAAKVLPRLRRCHPGSAMQEAISTARMDNAATTYDK